MTCLTALVSPAVAPPRRRTRVDDILDVDALRHGHVANDGEHSEACVETREEADYVDHDGIPAKASHTE